MIGGSGSGAVDGAKQRHAELSGPARQTFTMIVAAPPAPCRAERGHGRRAAARSARTGGTRALDGDVVDPGDDLSDGSDAAPRRI